MTAAVQQGHQATELERVIRRLRDAAMDLSRAADHAEDAIGDIESALEDESPKEARSVHGLIEAISVHSLAELVVRMHDEEHEGPRRWCTREACKQADAVLEID